MGEAGRAWGMELAASLSLTCDCCDHGGCCWGRGGSGEQAEPRALSFPPQPPALGRTILETGQVGVLTPLPPAHCQFGLLLSPRQILDQRQMGLIQGAIKPRLEASSTNSQDGWVRLQTAVGSEPQAWDPGRAILAAQCGGGDTETCRAASQQLVARAQAPPHQP